MLFGQCVLTLRSRAYGEIDQDSTRQDLRQPAVRHVLSYGEGLLQERGTVAIVALHDGQSAEPDQRKDRVERVAQDPAASQALNQARFGFPVCPLVDLNYTERDEGFRSIGRCG